MNKYSRHIAVLALICGGAAQAAEPWSLDSCINYAIEHNINVKSRALDVASGELGVTEAKDGFLPTLQAGANQSFDFGRGLTSDNTYANRNTSSFGWNVGLSLPLFQGLQNVRRLAYSKANLRALVEQSEAAKDDVTLNVISQYLQVLYTDELHQVALEQEHISQVEYDRRKVLLEAGKIAELDLTQAESQLAQDKVTAITTANDHTLALVDLAQLLELSSVEGFSIQPLADEQLGLLTADEVYRQALQTNHSVLAARLNEDAADKNISLAKSGWLPTLSFTAGLGSSYYHLAGFESAPFHRQMRDNFSKSIGFSLSIPIFDRFSTRNSVRRAKIQKLNAQLQRENVELTMYKTIQQAYYQAVAAEKRLSASETACAATKAALDAMQEKYNYGKANATEFEQAKTDYIRTCSEALQAKYEHLLRLRILHFYAQR